MINWLPRNLPRMPGGRKSIDVTHRAILCRVPVRESNRKYRANTKAAQSPLRHESVHPRRSHVAQPSRKEPSLELSWITHSEFVRWCTHSQEQLG